MRPGAGEVNVTQTFRADLMRYPVATTAQVLSVIEGKRNQALAELNERLEQGIDMRSRRGIDGAIWTILSVSLVVVLAVTVLFALGPKLIQLGQTAVSKVQSPPW